MKWAAFAAMVCTVTVLIGLSIACQAPKNCLNQEAKYVVNLNEARQSDLHYSSIFKSVEAITLDNSKTLLGGINKLLVHRNQFYILDTRSKGVYVFSRQGQFVRQIGAQGVAPHEYVDCRDFTINTETDEVLVYDRFQNRIYKYNAENGDFKGIIRLEKEVTIDYISYNGGSIYAANTFHRWSEADEPYYLLYKIDAATGKLREKLLDADIYNKGWKDEFIHNNLFYPQEKDNDLFVMGLMNVIMRIENGKISPYLQLEYDRLLKEADISMETFKPEKDTKKRALQMQQLMMNCMKNDIIYQINSVMTHGEKIYLTCAGRGVRYVCYDKKDGTTTQHARIIDDVLYRKMPSHSMVPKFLCSDEKGCFYYIQMEHLPEMKHFIAEDYVSDTLKGRQKLAELSDEANPVILYYEYQ